MDFDIFGHPIADEKVEVITGKLLDVFGQLIAGDAQRPAGDDAAERDDGHLGGAATDIDDEVPAWFLDRQPGTNRGCDRFLN